MTHPIKKYMAKNGLSTADVAEAAQISRMHLWRIMSRKGNFTTSTLARLSKATGVPIVDLLPETNDA